MPIGRSVAALFLLVATSLPLAAGDPPGEDPPQESGPAPTPRIELSGEMRWRNEFRDNSDFRPGDDFDSFLGQRLRLRLRVHAHPNLSFFLEGQDTWLFGAESDKIIHNTATNLHQLYLDWLPDGSERLGLRAGRQELVYGHERLVGGFNWDNVGRSFDGVRLRYGARRWRGDFFWGRLVDIRRRGARHRPGNRDLYGAYVTRSDGSAGSQTEIYGLFLRDGLRTFGEINFDAEATRIFTLGFRRVQAPATGFRYEVENAWQFGERGPDDHRAVALVANAGYVWPVRFQPSFRFEYAFATGDNDPGDGDSREFENLFPTNHLHYGYADLVSWRNLHDFRLTAIFRPHPKLTIQSDYHRFLLAERRGPWKNAGGRLLGFDPTGEAGRDLGQEVDLTFRVPLHPHVGFLAGYSVFLPGRFAVRTRGPDTHSFAYIQTSLKF